jgi:hypothetical protein
MILKMLEFNPDHLLYAGVFGIFTALVLLLLFIYNRIRRIPLLFAGNRSTIGVASSFRTLLLLMIWTALSGITLFMGAFLHSYHTFTQEIPVAEIHVRPIKKTNAAVITLSSFQAPQARFLIVKGDHWMLEGDILTWDPWLNLLGLQTRYRLTRIRGRYVDVAREIIEPATAFTLTTREDHPLWRYLYLKGHKLPFVSTVYGNAVFQSLQYEKRYLVYVTTSGFLVRGQE